MALLSRGPKKPSFSGHQGVFREESLCEPAGPVIDSPAREAVGDEAAPNDPGHQELNHGGIR